MRLTYVGGDDEFSNLWATTLSGLFIEQARVPRVARSSQPWALLRNPFGILRSVLKFILAREFNYSANSSTSRTLFAREAIV